MPGSEEAAVARGMGKWSQAGVPHKGWECVEIEDLGEPSQICDMCESQTIRYAHHMTHPRFEGELVVGCVCAGNMEGNLAAAEARDKKMRSRVGKRKRWLTRRWNVSKKGNDWITADGFRIAIYPRSRAWGALVASQTGTYEQHIRRRFSTPEQAKLAAFDLITSILNERE